MKVTLKKEGAVSKIILKVPPLNLLDIETMEALIDAHQKADADPATRVIVTASGVPAIFSNGLDPTYVLKCNDEERRAIFRVVARLLHTLFGLGKPHICLVNGPAMAGGAILAIPADFRLFDEERGRLSFSEPKVGLPIPRSVSSVIKFFCKPERIRDVVLLGRNMDAHDAFDAGLADGVAGGEDFREMTQKLIARLARMSPSVMRVTKLGMRQDILEITKAFTERGDEFDKFVGDQFLGEGLRALVQKRFADFKE